MAREKADISGEEKTSNLPPPLRKRLRKILTDHSHAIIHDRASVVRERRGDGRPYWRLYLESGSAQERERKRVYIGPEGGPELRQAIGEARRDHWLGCDSLSDFLKALGKILGQGAQEAREARLAGRCLKALLLAQTHRYSHGRTVRNRRGVAAVDRYRAEYRHLSHRALEQATWPGITEEQYIALRRDASRR